jgi:hypothetical protein
LKTYQRGVLRTICVSLIVIFGGAFGQSIWAKERDWQPQRTWVFVVGILEWQHKDTFDSFPQQNRRDAQLVEYFRRQGVPDPQIIFLRDTQATSRRVRNTLPTFLSKASPDDLLFLYYTGHGYKSEDEQTTYFATYDAGDDTDGWATDSIVRDIEKYFKGSRALLTADTCYSGSLALQTQKLGHRVSYATLASASASHLSTENWTFTEMLLAALRGESFADINGDGEVTLSELAEDIKEDMAFAEDQRSVFTTTGDFEPQMELAVAQRKIDPLISRRLEVRSEGDWYKARVIDVRGGSYRVHYFGFEDSDDEWVTQRQFRMPTILANSRNRAGAADVKSTQYNIGANVEVNWEGKWYAAKIMRNQAGRHLVHYVGYNEDWDEWVTDNKIRRPSWSN